VNAVDGERGPKGLIPDTGIVKECFAVVYAPGQKRKRFPENCVEPCESAAAAVAAASPAEGRHPARVIGPSRSSEGVHLYYLMDWLAAE
jgi:hypothetical protein